MLGRTNTGGGGGGGGLNFQVIPNPMPSTAKENTIWVDTDKINNYYFSATQPENMVDYDVWITTGTSSTVAFSATKKNPIMVYPMSAKQYIGGALVNKTAKSYQGGTWVGWITYFINAGAVVDGVVATANYSAFTAKDGYYEVKTTGANNNNASFKLGRESGTIDLSEFTKCYFDVEATSSRSGTLDIVDFGISDSASGTSMNVSKKQFKIGSSNPISRQTIEIDVSTVTSGYIGAYIGDNNGTVTLKIYNTWCA